MGLFIQILTFILIISILVILHEWGHFATARYFKTKVEKFYLFFNPWFSIFKKKIGETEYGIGWLPFGGYVKIAGMIDESMDKEQMKQPPKPWEFRSKPAWQRLIIMLGGIIVNVLLAWVIYTGLFIANGETYIPVNKIENGIYVDPISEKIGLKTGDKILAIDDNPVKKLDKYLSIDILLGNTITILRDGEEKTITLNDEGKKAALDSQGKQFIIPRIDAIVGTVQDSSIAKKGGLLNEDKIIAVNGQKIIFWDEFDSQIKSDTALELLVNRNGNELKLNFNTDKKGVLGVRPSVSASKSLFVTDEYSFFAAIPRGFVETYEVLVRQVKQFKLIFNPVIKGYKKVKGPIGIVTDIMPSTWDWGFFWNFLAMFSVWLAFINILPIPALDGGHAMFLIYEMVSGRPPSEKVLERGQIVGFVIVMAIMLLVIGNDIWNLF